MNQTTKAALCSFGILLLFIAIPSGWQAYERSRERAEQQRFCELLKQAGSVGEDTTQLSDADRVAIYQTRTMYGSQCP